MPQSIVQYDKTLPYIEDRNPWEVPVSYLKRKLPMNMNWYPVADQAKCFW